MRRSIPYIGLLFFLLTSVDVIAQKVERNYIRRGNRAFEDSLFIDAEINYRKAIELNPNSTISKFNLANTLLTQNKAQEAMELYVASAQIEKDKTKLGHIYHNIGIIFHSQKDYEKAIEAYKSSLRNNPKDDETRYNLALAQKMQKEQQQNQKQEQEQNQENQNDNQEQKENQEQQNQPPQKEQQQSQPQSNDNQMSKENAEQLLNSIMQDEKEVQEKVKKQQVIKGGRLEKDW